MPLSLPPRSTGQSVSKPFPWKRTAILKCARSDLMCVPCAPLDKSGNLLLCAARALVQGQTSVKRKELMTTNRKAIWAGLILCVVVATSCSGKKGERGPSPGPASKAAPHGQQDKRPFPVYIYTPDPSRPGECYADLAAVTIWAGHQQHVTWFSDDQKTKYTVNFTAGNPFPGHPKPFLVPGDSHGIDSGVPTNQPTGPTGNGYYPYEIQNEVGTQCKKADDPGVYVKP
jgi:hypothetical protein